MNSNNQNCASQIILNNFDSKFSNGIIDSSFKKTLYFEKLSECALLEISIPKNIYSTKKLVEVIFRFSEIYKIFEWKLKDEINENFKPESEYKFIYDIEDIEEIDSIEKLLKKFENIRKQSRVWIEEIYLLKFFEVYNLRLGLNFFLPEIKFENGKFKTTYGIIKNLAEKDKEISYVETAIVYYNFNEDLHRVLGYDTNEFPLAKFENNTVKQYNNGIAKYEPFIEYIENLYVYSDILNETYVGNIKANILRVFKRIKDSDEEYIVYKFRNLFFIPLRVFEINSIRIEIRDNFGHLINYLRGNIILTLLFQNSNKIDSFLS